MIKTLSQIEINVENKICRFIVDHDTPLTHVKEALFQMQKYIGQIEDSVKSKVEEEAKKSSEEQVKSEG